jgi:hypothetical protein
MRRLVTLHASQPFFDLVDPLQKPNERFRERIHPLAFGAGHFLISLTPDRLCWKFSNPNSAITTFDCSYVSTLWGDQF